MIRLDITYLIFYYILFSAAVVLIIWFVSGYRRRKYFARRDVDYIWKCAVCAHIYVSSYFEDITACPVCGSYNKREEASRK